MHISIIEDDRLFAKICPATAYHLHYTKRLSINNNAWSSIAVSAASARRVRTYLLM
ncbi:hypothetical protein GPUN_1302 [Glaciecola punicea ACAM 611]|jgi:hypothetical protein|uniref:Uncharacterized protein n=1 Tax=Glaciecola punicea ACAM 611 TaxID=1121923 RepID=H5TAU9_9ALTE|nr:hypothetical protein [Glaciecola punicea]GAB55426.1 hypothetical protein GPUN_1302 [Glaciecola punicea ACAM 611]